jgi:hydrogenase maturation factor
MMSDEHCSDGRCVTCSDEAPPARVLHVDREAGMARVAAGDTMAEVDISLVDEVAPGDLLLIHGGVAIARL